jgi:hypothetical protein
MTRMQRAAALLSLLLLLCGCASGGTVSDPAPASAVPETAASEPPAVKEEPAQADFALLRRVTVLRYGSAEIWINGEPYTLSVPTFLEDGVLYVPLADVAVLLGDSFLHSGDVYSLNHQGNVSILMPDYNVILVNNSACVMQGTPIVRDARICIPADGLRAALQCHVSKSPALGVCVLEHEETRLNEKQLRDLCLALDLPLADPVEDETLLALAARSGRAYAEIERLAVEGRLYLTDADGVGSLVTLRDDGKPVLTRYETVSRYEPDTLFRAEPSAEGAMLIRLRDQKRVGPTPDRRYVDELRTATGRFMELKAAAALLHDARAEALLPDYRAAVERGIFSDAFLADFSAPYDAGLFTEENRERGWETLFAAARPGDFLLFSAQDAGPAYGYFNHSALILEKNEADGSLRLLHARSAEYGVGSGRDMDLLTRGAFTENSYYRNYGTVFLCRAGSLSDEASRKMAQDANTRFDGMQFGYGGRLGLDEVNCAELIDESYRDAGVAVIDGDYDTRLKEVLKGNTKNLVPLPDDLMFSEHTEVLAVWKR